MAMEPKEQFATNVYYDRTFDCDAAKILPGEYYYTGKDMLTTHRGMNISEQEFVAVLDDAMDALDKCGVDAATRNEVLGVLWSMKKEVVRV